MTAPFLTRADMRYKDSYIAAAREFESEKRPLRWKLEMLEEHFDEYLQILHEKESDPQPGFVPQTEYWLIVDEEYIGTLSLRHFLNERLREFGGHIGYQIRPSRRRQGYGLIQCQLGLEKARARGLEKVMITCDDTNIGSIKIIEGCGGVLEDKIMTTQSPVLTRRYWITL